MKTLWLRFALWFGLTFMVVSALFVLVSYWRLEGRIPSKTAAVSNERFYPAPSGPGGQDIYWSRTELTRLEALYGAVMLVALTAVALLAVRKTLEPIRSLNTQLEAADGREIGGQVSAEDAGTDIGRLQDNINHHLARARLAIIHLNRYAAQVAHELRTPLTIMRLKIEQAADKIDPKLAEEIQAELLRLTMHVEQSLLIARAEQGHLNLNPVRFDLAVLLGEAVDDIRLLAREKGREVLFSSAQAYVTADPKYMKQILYNLLNNALRHGAGPLQVRIATRAREVAIVIGNQVKGPPADHLNLALGKRIVAALVGLHGNQLLRTRRLRDWYFVRLIVSLDNATAQATFT